MTKHTFAVSLALAACVVLAGCSARTEATGSSPKPSPAARLGRDLFFDSRLSATGEVSCASCHDPQKGFADGRRFSLGIRDQRTTRNSPGLVNVRDNASLFWDGRSDSLEDQALKPIQNPVEMGMKLEDLESTLRAIPEYRNKFGEVFRRQPDSDGVASAIAAFERSIVADDTRYDRYSSGDTAAMSESAVRGMNLFIGEARCFNCHLLPEFTDHLFHNIGVFEDDGRLDVGRFAISGIEHERGAFKTPSLREVGRTAPYMHNGRFESLEEVVQHYNLGGVGERENPLLDEILQPLNFTEAQLADLVAFLREGLSSADWSHR